MATLKTCRYFLKFSYIGTNYKGLQRQTKRWHDIGFQNDGTIQCAIEYALDRGLCPVYGSRLALSSRTDAGVHAYINTANVDLTHPLPETIYKPSFIIENTNRILSYLNHEILILDAKLVPSYFHSRINANWRSYIYRLAILNQISSDSRNDYNSLRRFLPLSQINRCHIVSCFDLDLLYQGCEIMKGEHDFVSFSSRDKNYSSTTIKNVMQLDFKRCGPFENFEQTLKNDGSTMEFYEFHIKSNSFLYNQVRRMVSALLDVGQKRITLDDLKRMLDQPRFVPASLSQMVPSYGLYLSDVGYNEEDFVLAENFNEYNPISPEMNFFDKKKSDSLLP